jgi:hypothetical protein
MKKYFCDECGKQLTTKELQFSLEMIWKKLCSKHANEHVERGTKKWTLKANGRTYEEDSSGFIYPID